METAVYVVYIAVSLLKPVFIDTIHSRNPNNKE